jgi:hypothetical protein
LIEIAPPRQLNRSVLIFSANVAMINRLLLPLVLFGLMATSISCGGANLQPEARYTKRLVHDTNTGQYIGVLTGECKVYDRKLD